MFSSFKSFQHYNILIIPRLFLSCSSGTLQSNEQMVTKNIRLKNNKRRKNFEKNQYVDVSVAY